jgi:hypothetical protein
MDTRNNRLNEALAEKAKLLSNYRRSRRREYDRLCQNITYGERFQALAKAIRRIGPDDGARLVEMTQDAMASWLGEAPEPMRYAVLSMIDDRCMTIRARLGMRPIDDPLPWEKESVFFLCKESIGVP